MFSILFNIRLIRWIRWIQQEAMKHETMTKLKIIENLSVSHLQVPL